MDPMGKWNLRKQTNRDKNSSNMPIEAWSRISHLTDQAGKTEKIKHVETSSWNLIFHRIHVCFYTYIYPKKHQLNLGI